MLNRQSAGGETQTARAEHQRVRKALLDAEIDLQKAAAASQDMHRQLQVSSIRRSCFLLGRLGLADDLW